jgi:UDP-glucose 4-epimerase
VALAEANRRFNPDLELFVMASTTETYGHHQAHVPFTETTPQYPAAPYAVAKVACEHYLRYMGYAYDFPYVMLRQTNTYGRHDNDFFVVERIISQMARGQECKLGTPVPWRNFLYIADLVRLYERIIELQPTGEVFVTGPDNALSIGELAGRIRELMDWKGHIEWNTLEPRPGEVYYLNTDPAKARAVLGWEPQIELDEGLLLTIAKWT